MAKIKRRGNVGQEIFDQVQKIVADQKVSMSQAFKQIAAKSGRNEGTVAANYYRIARLRGATRGRVAGAGGGKARAAAVLVKAQAVLKDLAGVIRAQETEIARL